MTFFNIVPSLPPYSGPYSVGSADVELPVEELSSPGSTPDDTDIGTVAFRIFYPCENVPKTRPIRWLPEPQKAHFAAYAKFVGAHSIVADGLSYFPNLLYYSTIPALRNAPLLRPETRDGRWPVMVFSHGLGGSRNAYSQICGSLASHGIVVVAADHRDASTPVSFVRATSKSPARVIYYKRYPHTPTQETYDGRDAQLKIRLWELGLIHDAIRRIDHGVAPQNLDPNSSTWRKKDTNEVLTMFRGTMNVHKPGSIIWAGHSFGACSVTQLVKSTFWGPVRGEKAVNNPLYSPDAESSLSEQITPRSPLLLLDMWGMPFQSPSTADLWDKPLPCYSPSGPGGKAVLSILSEAFFKWSGNMSVVQQALSSHVPGDSRPSARFFYPTTSAHLSQSDFGILFSWLIKRVLKTREPAERYIKLNARAMLQTLRENDYDVAETSALDREEVPGQNNASAKTGDERILDPQGGIPGWIAIPLIKAVDGMVRPDALSRPSSSSSSAGPRETEVLGEVQA